MSNQCSSDSHLCNNLSNVVIDGQTGISANCNIEM